MKKLKPDKNYQRYVKKMNTSLPIGITKPKRFNPVAALVIYNDVSKMNVDELIRLLNWIKQCHRDIDSEPTAYGKCSFRLIAAAKIAKGK